MHASGHFGLYCTELSDRPQVLLFVLHGHLLNIMKLLTWRARKPSAIITARSRPHNVYFPGAMLKNTNRQYHKMVS